MISWKKDGAWLALVLLASAGTIGAANAQSQQTGQSQLGQSQLGQSQAARTGQSAAARSGDDLSRHLTELAENPRSVPALMGAGRAALDLDDPQAALGFFARAEEMAPRDGRVKAGIGSALVMMEQGQSALKLFEEARLAGIAEAEFSGDRGLAYDLTGNSRLAQRDYQLALGRAEDQEIRRRLALSLAISGDRASAIAAIDGQLRQQNRAAWRARAFILALTGDTDGAVQAVEAVMPGQAAALRPFLVRLPTLSAADRALAVNFGHFPGSGQPALASNSAVAPNSATSGPATSSAMRAGQPDISQRPLGAGMPQQNGVSPTTAADRRAPVVDNGRTSLAGTVQLGDAALVQSPRGNGGTASPSAPPAPVRANPSQIPVAPAQSVTNAAAGGPEPFALAPSVVASNSPFESAASGQPPAPVPQAPATAASAVSPAMTPANSPASGPPRPSPVTAPATTVAFADVAAFVAALSAPAPEDAAPAPAMKSEPLTRVSKAAPIEQSATKTVATRGQRQAGAPQAKAGDARKAVPAAKVREPGRIWVQIAHGAPASYPAIYARLKSKAPRLFAGKAAWTASGKTNRLLVGPFKSDKESQDFVNQMDKADMSSFSWTSPAGQEIKKLSAK